VILASSSSIIGFYFRVVLFVAFSAFFALPANSQILEPQTLAKIKERGHLICGASQPLFGFAQKNSEGLWSGFDVDFCRALSSAIFGNPDKVEFKPYNGLARFAPLQLGDVDVFVRNAYWNLRRDSVYNVSYVGTSFFDGQAFLAKKDLGVVSSFELKDVLVCVIGDSDEQDNLAEFFFKNQSETKEIIYENYADMALAYNSNLCDVISAPVSQLYSIMSSLKDPASHQILPERISKQPLGPVVRTGDDEWFNIVRWVLFTLLNAEELGVNSLSVASMKDTKNPKIRRLLSLDENFGKAIGLEKNWAKNIIANVGNYREIYEKSFGPQTGVALPRGSNALWINGGLLFAPPIR